MIEKQSFDVLNRQTTGSASAAEKGTTDADQKVRQYGRRWLILALFCAVSMSNAYQWIHLNILFDVVKSHYNASLPSDETRANMAIDWLSMIYMLAYILFVLPAAWILERFGLKTANICAAALNFAGAFVKCFASGESTFPLLFFGQGICGIAQSFILGFPAPLAAAWFGIDELSMATALGVFGNQIGVALGFVVPPLAVATHGPDTRRQLLGMYIGGACVTGALLALMALVFQDQPPLPPSIGQAAVRERRAAAAAAAAAEVNSKKKPPNKNDDAETDDDQVKVAGPFDDYVASLGRLLRNRNFALLTVSYGVNTGTFYALSTLLNPIVVPEFHKRALNVTAGLTIEQHVGWSAFVMILAGIAGSLLAGFVLDSTKQFKLVTLIIYALSCASAILFTATLPLVRISIVYMSMLLLGFFMTGYLPVGFEFAAEITYPENEGLSSGILNMAAQMLGISLTLSVRAVVDNASTAAGNAIFCGLLFAGTLMTAVIKSDLRRQSANKTVLTGAAATDTSTDSVNGSVDTIATTATTAK